MSIRQKGKTWIVEVYDPATKAKRHVKAAEFGMDVPRNEAQAKRLERAALNARDQRAGDDETCNAFAARWTTDFPRKSPSTNLHNHERVSIVAEHFKGRTLRSIERAEARALARQQPSRIGALRAMWADAIAEGLADIPNVFAGLGVDQSRGREDIVVLTETEIGRLREIAVSELGEGFGVEFASMIAWAAYTCKRPGEVFAARFSRLRGDVYEVATQFHSKMRAETIPKHGGDGLIYVPEKAREAVLSKPRRLGDDLMFRTKRGKQFRQGSLHEAWKVVRAVFTAELPADHHLRRRLAADPEDRLDFYELRHFGASYMLNNLEIEAWVIAEQLRHKDGGALVLKLYGHPERRRAIDRIRRAYGDSVVQLPSRSGESRGIAARRSP